MDGITRIALLQHYLQHNHFPPLEIGWVNVADTALQAAERNDWFSEIRTPIGMRPVREILDGLHLWEFVTIDDPEVDPASKTVLYDGEGDEDELFQVVGVVWADDDQEAGDE